MSVIYKKSILKFSPSGEKNQNINSTITYLAIDGVEPEELEKVYSALFRRIVTDELILNEAIRPSII